MVFFRRSASLPRAWYDRWWWSCGRGKKTWVKLWCIVGADSADSADSADCACAVAGPWKISSHTKAWRRDLREGSSPGEPPTPARPSRPTPSALLHLVASFRRRLFFICMFWKVYKAACHQTQQAADAQKRRTTGPFLFELWDESPTGSLSEKSSMYHVIVLLVDTAMKSLGQLWKSRAGQGAKKDSNCYGRRWRSKLRLLLLLLAPFFPFFLIILLPVTSCNILQPSKVPATAIREAMSFKTLPKRAWAALQFFSCLDLPCFARCHFSRSVITQMWSGFCVFCETQQKLKFGLQRESDPVIATDFS